MKTAAELFWSKVEVGWTHDCWEWMGSVLPSGYGQFSSGKNRGMSTLAHRASYTLTKGNPRELQVDHLCHNKKCVNPQHLEAVTAQVNTQRAHDDGLIKNYRNGNTGKTHCPRGHEYDMASARGRGCRKCANEMSKLHQRRKRAKSQ